MYIAWGRGRQPPGDKVLMSTEMSCHFIHLLQVSKKCLWSLILYNFFYDLIHVSRPGAGADSPQGTKFWCQQKCLVTSFICCKFQKKSLWSLFYTFFFFQDFIHVYSPKAGADNPLGTKFLCQQEHLVTFVICCKFQKNLFEVWFYTVFFIILYMYIAPRGQNFDVSLYPFVASFKEISLKSDFIQFFSWFNTCIYPRDRWHIAPRGQSFDVNRNFLSLRSSVASFKS